MIAGQPLPCSSVCQLAEQCPSGYCAPAPGAPGACAPADYCPLVGAPCACAPGNTCVAGADTPVCAQRCVRDNDCLTGCCGGDDAAATLGVCESPDACWQSCGPYARNDCVHVTYRLASACSGTGAVEYDIESSCDEPVECAVYVEDFFGDVYTEWPLDHTLDAFELESGDTCSVPVDVDQLLYRCWTVTAPHGCRDFATRSSEAVALQTRLDDWAGSRRLLGATASVRRTLPGGEIRSWNGASGLFAPNGRLMAAPDPMAIGSVTKTFVAALALRLTEQGIVSLDDPVTIWVPEAPPGTTLRGLLSHNTAIGNYLDVLLANGTLTIPHSPEELLALATTAPPMPGAYSNTNYVLAALVLERASGRSIGALLEEEIIAPAGLESTSASIDYASPLLASPTDHHRDGLCASPWMLPHPSNLYGAGSMVATAEDLATFLARLSSGEVITPASVETMFTLHNPSLMYGLGLELNLCPGQFVAGHLGVSLGGWCAFAGVDPASGTTVAVLSNTLESGCATVVELGCTLLADPGL